MNNSCSESLADGSTSHPVHGLPAVPPERIAALDFLRALAIFGVLILHSRFTSRFTKETLEVQSLLMRLFDWSVLAFFFCSGFLHNQSIEFGKLAKKRFISLLLPFFLYNAIYNLIFACISINGAVVNRFEMSAMLLVTGWFHSPAFQLYFLPYLFAISLLVCALDKLRILNHRRTYFLILFLILLFYFVYGYPSNSFGPARVNIPLYLASFLIGVLIRPQFEKQFSNQWLTLPALAIALGFLLWFRLPVVSIAVPPLVLAAGNIFLSVCHIRLIVGIGAISGCIYLWHTPILLPVSTRIWAYLGIPSILNLFFSLVLTIATCMVLHRVLALFFSRFFNRPVPKYLA